MKPRRAECIRIRKSDGARCFKVYYNQGGYTYEWQCGVYRAPGVKVGDKGVLEYVGTATNGYYRFTKDKESKS